MAEYIKRDTLKKAISALETAGAFTESFKNAVLKIISEEPAADVAEVRHGKWNEDRKVIYTTVAGTEMTALVGYRCSLCNRAEFLQEPYCNCGAKMDLEAGE